MRFLTYLSQWKDISKELPRTILFVWKASPLYFSICFAFTLIRASFPSLQIWVSKLIIDGIVEGIKLAHLGRSPNLDHLFFLLLLQVGFWIASKFLDSLSDPIEAIMAERVGHKVTVKVLEKAATLELAYFENPIFYDRLENARRLVDRPFNFSKILFWFLVQMLSLLTMLAILSRLHPLIALILFSSLSPYMAVKVYYSKKSWDLRVEQTPKIRLMGYLAAVLTMPSSSKEVRIFGLKDLLLGRYQEIWGKFFRERKRLFMVRNLSVGATGILGSIGAGAAYGYAIWKAAMGRITIGDFALYVQAVNRFQNFIEGMFFQFSQLYESGLELKHLFEFLNLPERIDNSRIERRGKALSRPIHGRIEFRNVSFRYPGTDRLVLKSINLTIDPESCVALVGENGAGKTTMVKLMLGLYRPTSGRVLIDGIPVEEYPLEDLWRYFAVIFQDFCRYHLTVRENIGFGDLRYLEDLKRIQEAARKGGAEELISHLPKGYETYLGKWLFEDGVDLSAGEWQKIALSRAFLRDEARILILDEPTASLDVRSEYEIYKRFSKLMKGKTVVLVSHRFSTVRMADRIIVLQRGRIVEEGSHEELMKLGGLYSQMFRMQAERYL